MTPVILDAIAVILRMTPVRFNMTAVDLKKT